MGDELVKRNACFNWPGDTPFFAPKGYHCRDGIPSDGNNPTMCAPGTKDENKTGCWDATQEETFHMITDTGFANVYPEVFACHDPTNRSDYGPPFSELHKTMM